jgi:HD-like signal output (HDOD) protein
MVIYLLSMVVVAVSGIAMLPLVFRKARHPAVVVAGPPGGIKVDRQSEIVLELPDHLQHLEPPVLQAAPVQILDRTEIFRRLSELALGVPEFGPPQPEHDRILAAALAAISDAATQRRYAPRRPNLLPQLMRAVNDEEVSRRELAAIIARDPSLVGSLLKMANSAFYRVTSQPIESIQRAIVMLGSDGLRSLIATALVQPIFQMSVGGPFPRFPEIVWEHAMRSAQAAIPHAALVERLDGFAAELLCLVTGLAEIVLFRAAMDHYATASRHGRPDPLVIASLLSSQSATFAWHIGVSWELSEAMLAALEEQIATSEPATPLGRSLRFGRGAGALAVLRTNSLIDDTTMKLSLPASGLSPAHVKCLWKRLLNTEEDIAQSDRPNASARARARAARAAA